MGTEKAMTKRRQAKVVIPFEYIKFMTNVNDSHYEFRVANVYVNYERDLVEFVLEPDSPSAQYGVTDLPAGQERPVIGKYGEKGLSLKVIGHTELAED